LRGLPKATFPSI